MQIHNITQIQYEQEVQLLVHIYHLATGDTLPQIVTTHSLCFGYQSIYSYYIHVGSQPTTDNTPSQGFSQQFTNIPRRVSINKSSIYPVGFQLTVHQYTPQGFNHQFSNVPRRVSTYNSLFIFRKTPIGHSKSFRERIEHKAK